MTDGEPIGTTPEERTIPKNPFKPIFIGGGVLLVLIIVTYFVSIVAGGNEVKSSAPTIPEQAATNTDDSTPGSTPQPNTASASFVKTFWADVASGDFESAASSLCVGSTILTQSTQPADLALRNAIASRIGNVAVTGYKYSQESTPTSDTSIELTITSGSVAIGEARVNVAVESQQSDGEICILDVSKGA